MSKPFYTERQRYSQWWLHLIIILACASAPVIFGYAFYQQLYLGEPFGDEPMSDVALIAFGSTISVLTIMIYVLFYYTALEIKIYDDIITYRFRPFTSAHGIPVEDIQSWEVQEYKPMREYAGWGWRISLKGRGWAYSVKGNKGLYIVQKSGKKLLIGTQNPIELREVMRRVAPSTENKANE